MRSVSLGSFINLALPLAVTVPIFMVSCGFFFRFWYQSVFPPLPDCRYKWPWSYTNQIGLVWGLPLLRPTVVSSTVDWSATFSRSAFIDAWFSWARSGEVRPPNNTTPNTKLRDHRRRLFAAISSIP